MKWYDSEIHKPDKFVGQNLMELNGIKMHFLLVLYNRILKKEAVLIQWYNILTHN